MKKGISFLLVLALLLSSFQVVFGYVEYDGEDPNAPWRAEADQRIDLYRKGDIIVQVNDANGNGAANEQVEVQMLKHSFPFGSVVQPRITDSVNTQYRDTWMELFNFGQTISGFVMLDDPTAPGTNPSRDNFYNGFQWAADNGYELNGSAASYIHDDYTYIDSATLLEDIKQAIENSITDPRFVNIIGNWSIMNECFGARIASPDNRFCRRLSNAQIADLFAHMRQVDPNRKYNIKEARILSQRQRDDVHDRENHLFQIIDDMDVLGQLPDQISFQSHHGGTETGIPEVYSILNRFGKFGAELVISEYDHSISDEQLASDYLRDFMKITFSHPSITEFMFWGHWSGSHWKNNAPFYRADWTPKPAKDMYMDLVYNQWWTDESGVTDADGMFKVRGFKGDYKITVDGNDYYTSVHTSEGITVTYHDGVFTEVANKPEKRHYIINDNFNSGTVGSAPSGWIVNQAANTNVTVEMKPTSMNRSVQITDTNTNGYGRISQNLGSLTEFIVEFSFMQPVDVDDAKLMVLRNGGSTGLDSIGIYTSDGNLVYKDPGNNDYFLANYTAGEWMDVKLIVNANTNRYDVYVDGLLVKPNVAFIRSATDLDYILLGSSIAGTGTVYYDDIKVSIADPTPYWINENFDSLAEGSQPGGWAITTAPNTTAVVANVPSAENKSMRFTDNNTNGYARMSHHFAPATSLTAEFSFMQPEHVNNARLLSLRHNGNDAIGIYTDNGNLVYKNVGGFSNFVTPYTEGEWMDVKVVADATTEKFDLYVNDNLVLSNVSFMQSASSINSVLTGGSIVGTGTVYIDNIKVGDY